MGGYLDHESQEADVLLWPYAIPSEIFKGTLIKLKNLPSYIPFLDRERVLKEERVFKSHIAAVICETHIYWSLYSTCWSFNKMIKSMPEIMSEVIKYQHIRQVTIDKPIYIGHTNNDDIDNSYMYYFDFMIKNIPGYLKRSHYCPCVYFPTIQNDEEIKTDIIEFVKWYCSSKTSNMRDVIYEPVWRVYEPWFWNRKRDKCLISMNLFYDKLKEIKIEGIMITEHTTIKYYYNIVHL